MKPPAASRRITATVLVVDGSYSSTAIGPLEVLHSAGRLWNALNDLPESPCFDIQVASVGGRAVSNFCSIGLTPHVGIDQIAHSDLVLVSATSLALFDPQAHDTILPWLRAMHARGAYMAGICTGVALLAEAGLLDGRRATTHWAVAPRMVANYPLVQWHPERMITEDGHVFCAGGVYASMDLSLYLVEKFCGREIALQCAKALLLNMPRHNQSAYALHVLSRPHEDRNVRLAEDYLQQHFNEDVTVQALAERVGMSTRNFVRRFRAATGQMPGTYVQNLRMAAAKSLLESATVPVQSVCQQVGYQDTAHFRQLFRRHTGMTPTDYRERFASLGGVPDRTIAG